MNQPPLNILLGAPVKAHGAPNNLRTLPVNIYRGGEVLVCIVYIIHIHRYVTCMSTWIASPPCEWKRMKTESDSPAHDYQQVNSQCNCHVDHSYFVFVNKEIEIHSRTIVFTGGGGLRMDTCREASFRFRQCHLAMPRERLNTK